MLGRITKLSATVAGLAALALLTAPEDAAARRECAGETEVICVESCGDQAYQNHQCNEQCGPTWHADSCGPATGPCITAGIVCHNSG
jgi:hypothetical protein